MNDYNKYIATGRLTRDVELTYTPSGKAVAKGSIAVNKTYKEVESTTFVDFTVWEKSAEILAEYTKKGSRILIDGRLEQDTWEKDGKKYSKLYVNLDNFQFLDKKEA